MIVPAAVYIGINLIAGHPENLAGWAVPIATDIAFALAVLAVLSTHLPTALRTFLLTLAVVDDLLAITVIAIFFTDHLSLGPLALALIPIGLFGVAVQRGMHHWWLSGPAGRGRLGAGARQRRARHRRRRITGLHRAGARQAWQTNRRTLRTHHETGVGGLRRADIRVLRRRSDGRGLVGLGRGLCFTRSPTA